MAEKVADEGLDDTEVSSGASAELVEDDRGDDPAWNDEDENKWGDWARRDWREWDDASNDDDGCPRGVKRNCDESWNDGDESEMWTNRENWDWDQGRGTGRSLVDQRHRGERYRREPMEAAKGSVDVEAIRTSRSVTKVGIRSRGEERKRRKHISASTSSLQVAAKKHSTDVKKT